MDKHLKIDYIELPCSDLLITQAFFEQVFNWQFKLWGDEYMDTGDGRLMLGFYRTNLNSQYAKGGALVTFYSKELEHTRQAVIDAGGQIVTDLFEFPGGKRFHFTEPCGNEFAVWSEA
ncbi:hypothetical protein C2869_02855 [Saccharobesus litoralis]|uniref:VOC domain-containing protein n=1 Tax=Saccharobesus litoralis TaxID=2172099 RepID=A0A2S0VMJ6_9ALTE|nr:VOC family protein [Saccharobesus litoralis]AWB65438.1 hypothetical protein C2869_02855 [Saccharobesus litoralis]